MLSSFFPIDTNEDNFLDEQELEALFTKEVRSHQKSYLPHLLLTATTHSCVCVSLQLEKVYDPKNEEDDMMEMEEERLRMREHVMKNVSVSHPFFLSLCLPLLLSHLVSP